MGILFWGGTGEGNWNTDISESYLKTRGGYLHWIIVSESPRQLSQSDEDSGGTGIPELWKDVYFKKAT